MDEKIQEKENLIASNKALLNGTDYQVIKTLENLLSVETTTELFNVLKNIGDEIKETVRTRKKAREIINETEAEIEAL